MTQLDFDLNVTPVLPAMPLPSAESLAHPYARYGLAVTLAFHTNRKPMAALTEAELREALAHALESGLNSFRMETLSKPERDEELKFSHISLEKLRSDPGLVSGSLAARGMYLYPSIITSDRQAKGAFADAEKVLADIKDKQVPLDRIFELKRSVAPIAGEINNAKSNKENIKGTLFEAACTAIATVASEKPSALMTGSNPAARINTGIFPDLDAADLIEFVRVFYKFQAEGNDRLKGKPAKGGKYKRPPIHDGNYPNAPRDDAFGAVGLLAAMGYWASRADETTKKETRAVLDSLKNKPFYLVSYDGVSQASFQHHIVELAKVGSLQTILSDFYREARPYSVYEEPYLRTDLPLVRHFYFATSRFLQRFDAPAFRDFLATRAEYPPSLNLLLETYFMQDGNIPRSTVESARALGQWINRSAYFVAEDDTDKGGQNRTQAVRKAKAKVLVEFESAIMSASSPEDMLHRVSTRAGRLLQADAPAEATAFFDDAASGEIPFKTAQHLLIAYLRLRTAKTPGLVTADVPADDDSDLAEKETE